GPTVNAASPLVLGDRLFVTANYGVGAVWSKMGRDAAEQIWASDEVMSSQYTTPVALGQVLYGLDGRQDVGVARLRAVDPERGKVLWTEEGIGTGNVIVADGKILLLTSGGALLLVDPSPTSTSRWLGRSYLTPRRRRLRPWPTGCTTPATPRPSSVC